MALSIHTDAKFEKQLEWLSRRLQKTKTDVVKDLVQEKFYLKKSGFQFGALRGSKKYSSKDLQKELKLIDKDYDLG